MRALHPCSAARNVPGRDAVITVNVATRHFVTLTPICSNVMTIWFVEVS